jgi:hypothetical protein
VPSKVPITPVRLQPAARRDLDRLAKLLSRERGHPVSRTEAVATAITEAVRRREAAARVGRAAG